MAGAELRKEKLVMRTIQGKPCCNVQGAIASDIPPARRVRIRRWPFVLAATLAGVAIALPEASTETPGQPARIEVTHFAGDTVQATIWNERGERDEVHLHPRDLVGLTWTAEACDGSHCEAITHRITAVARDASTNTMPQHGDNSDVWLYRVESALASTPDQWLVTCNQGDPDDAMGIFVNGQWSEDGTWRPEGWTFSCPSGVISKCIRSWGYKPWKKLHASGHGEVALQPLHQACVRAARADYCGNGTSYTRNGTEVDMFDVYGFNVQEDNATFAAESTFDEHGALSVSFPRWPAGTATETAWQLESCERPRQAPPGGASPLIHVWSDPAKGRSAPPR